MRLVYLAGKFLIAVSISTGYVFQLNRLFLFAVSNLR